MKTILFFNLSLIFIGFQSCSGMTEDKTDLEKANLNGKVNSIKEISYKAIQNFGEPQKGEIASILIPVRWYNFGSNSFTEYNSDGDVINVIEYNNDGTIQSKTNYVYNESDNLIEENQYNSEGELSIKYKYSYNEKGALIEVISYDYYDWDNSGDIIYTDHSTKSMRWSYLRNSSNDIVIIEISSFFLDSELLSDKVFFNYNNSGNLIEKLKYYYKPNQLTHLMDSAASYKMYYDKNEKIKLIEDFSFKNVKNQANFYHNQNGEVEKVEILINEEREVWTFQYVYDKNKNWIKRIDSKNDVPKNIVERKINYF